MNARRLQEFSSEVIHQFTEFTNLSRRHELIFYFRCWNTVILMCERHNPEINSGTNVKSIKIKKTIDT